MLYAIDSTVDHCRCHLSSFDSVLILLLANGIDAVHRINSGVLCAIDRTNIAVRY